MSLIEPVLNGPAIAKKKTYDWFGQTLRSDALLTQILFFFKVKGQCESTAAYNIIKTTIYVRAHPQPKF